MNRIHTIARWMAVLLGTCGFVYSLIFMVIGLLGGRVSPPMLWSMAALTTPVALIVTYLGLMNDSWELKNGARLRTATPAELRASGALSWPSWRPSGILARRRSM